MYHIVVNPVSGNGKSKKPAKAVVEYLTENKIEFILYSSEYLGHPTIIAQKICSEYIEGGKIIIVGGDGTINETINGIDNLDKWEIGIIPAGTGNDLVRLSSISKDAKEAIEIITKSEAKPTDYIQVNEYRCLNVCATGIDIDVLRRCEKMKIFRGKLRYYISLFITLVIFKWYKMNVQIDNGETKNKVGLIGALCNGSFFGGGIPIYPKTSIDDGKLNFVFINKINKIMVPIYLLNVLQGKILKYKFVDRCLCEKVVYTNDFAFPFNIDGQIIYAKKFECTIVKGGIKLFR